MIKEKKTTTTSLPIEESLLTRLDNYRYDSRITRSEAIRQAIAALLDKEGY